MLMYEFLYNDNIWESAYRTISLHLTREGAEKAMERHKLERRKRYEGLANEDWLVKEIEVLP